MMNLMLGKVKDSKLSRIFKETGNRKVGSLGK